MAAKSAGLVMLDVTPNWTKFRRGAHHEGTPEDPTRKVCANGCQLAAAESSQFHSPRPHHDYSVDGSMNSLIKRCCNCAEDGNRGVGNYGAELGKRLQGGIRKWGMETDKDYVPACNGGACRESDDTTSQNGGGNPFLHDAGTAGSRSGAWKLWKMRPPQLGKWGSSSNHPKAFFSSTAWTLILVLLPAVSFLSLSFFPSILRSGLLHSPDPPLCHCTTSIDGKTSFPELPASRSESNPSLDSSDFSDISNFSPPVLQLLDELKQARKLAEGDGYQPISEEAIETWRREHSCRARAELPPLYAGRKLVEDAPPNPQWAAVFQEYSHLHRVCMRRVGGSHNLNAVFNEKRVIPGCKFMTGESVFGLGNKLTYAASLMLYAVITKRVVLFPWGTAPWIMCEPFEGSAWTLPWGLENLNRRIQENGLNVGKDSNSTESFLAWVDAANGIPSSPGVEEGFFHAEMDDGWHMVNRFYCETEQKFLTKVEWLSAAGCLYFLPKLHSIASFRPLLESLFPKPGLTLTYLTRSAFLPNDEAWDRVRRIYSLHLQNADRRVSIQPRYRHGQWEHDQLSTHVNAHIIKCLQGNGILPNVTQYSSSLQTGNPSPEFPVVKVMITSLYTGLYDHLNEMYLQQSTVNGESVGLVQVSHKKEQGYGQEEDLQALVEIICLSLSDAILATPLSTFGGAAQVYGALTPWLIEFNDQEEASCVRSPSVDICYQLHEAHSVLSCPYEPAVNGTSVLETSKYIHQCSPMERPGILLLTN